MDEKWPTSFLQYKNLTSERRKYTTIYTET